MGAAARFMARRSALDHEHRRDVAERLALEYLPAGEPAGIKAQIARKEEEIDQLRQTVAGLRRRLEELEDDGRERNQAG